MNIQIDILKFKWQLWFYEYNASLHSCNNVNKPFRIVIGRILYQMSLWKQWICFCTWNTFYSSVTIEKCVLLNNQEYKTVSASLMTKINKKQTVLHSSGIFKTLKHPLRQYFHNTSNFIDTWWRIYTRIFKTIHKIELMDAPNMYKNMYYIH